MAVLLSFITSMLYVALIVSALAFLFYLVRSSIVTVEEDKMGIIFKKETMPFLSRPLPSHRMIAVNQEVGWQADTLSSGRHWGYFPWLYSVIKVPLVHIPPGQIGLVVANDGEALPTERQLGRTVDCKKFQDARAFLLNGGQKGPQLDILTAGDYRINTKLFLVILAENAEEHGLSPSDLMVYTVKTGYIGIVTTRDGTSMQPGEIAGGLVQGHQSFQDGQKFIESGGCKGLQEEFLSAGSYNLNPWLVKVAQIPLTLIPTGTVGVIISDVGQTLPDAYTSKLVDPGYKGIWKIPLDPGEHPINRYIRRVEIVPTHEITLDWSNKDKPSWNYDANLRPLQLRSRDGFVFDIEVTQVISIKPEDAPKMMLRVGSVGVANRAEVMVETNSNPDKFVSIRNLVNRVLEPMIGNYFRNSAQDYGALDFLENRSQRQTEAIQHIKNALSGYGVQAIGTFINEIDLPDDLERVLQQRKIAEEESKTYQMQTDAEANRQKLAEARAKTKMQEALVEARYAVPIARLLAAAKHHSNEASADAIRLDGQAQADAVRALVDVLTQDGYLASLQLENLSNLQLPSTIVGSSGMIDALFAKLFGTQHSQLERTALTVDQLIVGLMDLARDQPGAISAILARFTDTDSSEQSQLQPPTLDLLSDSDADESRTVGGNDSPAP